MKRYKNDIDKIKASNEIKQQTIQMMKESLHSKETNYKRSFQLALSTSLALFICTVLLSITLIDQRFNNKEISFDSPEQMMQMECEDVSEDMSFSAKSMAPTQPEAMMIDEDIPEAMMMDVPEQDIVFYDENRIICGAITHIDNAFIEIDEMTVYIGDYTIYSNEITVGNNVEIIVYYIDNKPYAEWIELNEK